MLVYQRVCKYIYKYLHQAEFFLKINLQELALRRNIHGGTGLGNTGYLSASRNSQR